MKLASVSRAEHLCIIGHWAFELSILCNKQSDLFVISKKAPSLPYNLRARPAIHLDHSCSELVVCHIFYRGISDLGFVFSCGSWLLLSCWKFWCCTSIVCDNRFSLVDHRLWKGSAASFSTPSSYPSPTGILNSPSGPSSSTTTTLGFPPCSWIQVVRPSLILEVPLLRLLSRVQKAFSIFRTAKLCLIGDIYFAIKHSGLVIEHAVFRHDCTAGCHFRTLVYGEACRPWCHRTMTLLAHAPRQWVG